MSLPFKSKFSAALAAPQPLPQAMPSFNVSALPAPRFVPKNLQSGAFNTNLPSPEPQAKRPREKAEKKTKDKPERKVKKTNSGSVQSNENVFEAHMGSAKLFKRIIAALNEFLATDVMFDLRPNGISMQSMDLGHSGLAHLFLHRIWFQQPYLCKESITIGLKLDVFHKVLNVAHDTDEVTLSLKSTDPDSMYLEFTSVSGRKTRFTMKLLDMEQEKLDIPYQEHIWTITLPYVEFRRLITELHVLDSKELIMKFSKQWCTLSVKSDLAEGEIVLMNGVGAEERFSRVAAAGQIEDGEEVKGKQVSVETEVEIVHRTELSDGVNELDVKFALRSLDRMSKTKDLSDFVRLHISPATPMQIEYVLGEENPDKGFSYDSDDYEEANADFAFRSFLKLYLAPLIEDEKVEDLQPNLV